jgi:hypothetical protein
MGKPLAQHRRRGQITAEIPKLVKSGADLALFAEVPTGPGALLHFGYTPEQATERHEQG